MNELIFDNGYCDIIVVRGKYRYKFYEKEVHKDNLCLFQPYRSNVRDEEYKAGNTQYFKNLFNCGICLIGEMVF